MFRETETVFFCRLKGEMLKYMPHLICQNAKQILTKTVFQLYWFQGNFASFQPITTLTSAMSGVYVNDSILHNLPIAIHSPFRGT